MHKQKYSVAHHRLKKAKFSRMYCYDEVQELSLHGAVIVRLSGLIHIVLFENVKRKGLENEWCFSYR